MSSAGRLVLAYHGCDAAVEDQLVARSMRLRASANRYDWLGGGIYFFEDDSQRALHFAQSASAHPERRYTRRPIETPSVVGAVLRIERWLDLTTQAGVDEFFTAFEGLSDTTRAGRGRMPTNRPAGPDDEEVILHNLDRAVIDFLHEARELQQLPAYQAVRGAFVQGPPVAETSAIRRRTHVQLALRDVSCVVGYFRVSR